SSLATDELGLLLCEKGGVTALEVLGIEAIKAFLVFGFRNGLVGRQTSNELLVPAGDQWRPFRNADGGIERFLCDKVVRHYARHQAFSERLGSIQNTAFVQ